jgi:cob(I)alamin adenosyltransferase
MGYRLSRIYTRTGDDGTTGLGDGSRVDKDDSRVEAFGAVDELNCVIGLMLTEELPPAVREAMVAAQHTLFDVGGELSIPGHRIVAADSVDDAERLLDALNARLAPLKEFILPGGTRAAALCHLARAVCRRAERRVITLAHGSDVSPDVLRYLNRLSDLLFVVARTLNREGGVGDVLWEREVKRTED